MDTYRRTQTVRINECDSNLCLRPESILHWIQDIAEEHASTLGFGYEMCMRQQLAWVEVRLLADISRMPRWKEDIRIETWSYPLSPVVAGREFSMTDAGGQTLVRAATHWVLIDVDRRRPVALKKHLPYFSDILDFEPSLAITGELPEAGYTPVIRRFRAENHHVDFNKHVNNSAYLQWALDSLPAERQTCPVKQIRIEFKKESLPGEEIDVSLTPVEAGCVFSLHHHKIERARIGLSWHDGELQNSGIVTNVP